ncbi:Cell death protease [Physocladia obscura]|uniref:Carboxypeptidase n=1 Tax=Physocladia obscura TaxID=109957 RepID=A0AAD5T9K0_9FUNG|nr:Cell death protease [Physocladia obscura]
MDPFESHLMALNAVDQPLGTGFSVNLEPLDSPSNEYQVGSQFVAFLNGFYATFPETRNWNLYLAGESYAGTYIPYISGAINNCGLYLDTINFFKDKPQLLPIVANVENTCMTGVTDCENWPQYPFQCNLMNILNVWYQSNTTQSDAKNCFDPYNIILIAPCGQDSYWKDENHLASYLNKPEVRAAIHVDPFLKNTRPEYEWSECRKITISTFSDEFLGFSSGASFFGQLIENRVKIIIYNGDNDYLIDFIGVEAVLDDLV